MIFFRVTEKQRFIPSLMWIVFFHNILSWTLCQIVHLRLTQYLAEHWLCGSWRLKTGFRPALLDGACPTLLLCSICCDISHKSVAHTEMCSMSYVPVHYLMHVLISHCTVLPQTLNIICPPKITVTPCSCSPSASLPHYLLDLSSLFLPYWLTSPRPEECLTLVSGWILAVLAPKHVQLFLMSSSRSGLWAS